MTQETNNVSHVLNEIDMTIKAVGTEKLLEVLKYTRISQESITEEKINRSFEIINLVCEEFGISTVQFFSLERKYNRRIVIGICAYLIQKELDLDNANLSYIFKKPDQTISLYKIEIIKLNPKILPDKKILDKIEIIKEKLKNNKND